MLTAAYRERGFPLTIVRPSHTYDDTMIPTMGGWTDIARLRAGRPVVIHGDGTTPWTLTHADDFAVGFTGLLGHPGAIGEAYTLTGTHAPSWNQIYRWLADAAGVPEPSHVVLAMGRTDAEARQVLRFTLGRTTADADVDAVLAVLPDVVERAKAASGPRSGGGS